MSSPDKVSVGYYAPELGSEGLSAPDYCLKKLLEEYTGESRVEYTIFAHELKKAPNWIPNTQTVVIPRTPGFLEKKINSAGVDVVHLNRYYDLLNPYFIDSPTVLTYHGDLQWEYPEMAGGKLNAWLMRAVETVKLPAFNEIVFVSHDLKNRVENRYQFFSLDGHVIYNGVDDTVYRQLPVDEVSKDGLSEPFMLHASNLTEKKNPNVLIDAYCRVAEKTNVNLIICGSGWKESDHVTRRLSELQLQDRVKRLGYVPEEQLVRLYNRALLFVFPSKHETFGLPVIEAMSCGTPVVTSNVYSLPEIARGNAELCSPESSDALAKSLLELIEDGQKRVRLAQSGLERAKDFDWEDIGDKYHSLYISMCTGR